MKPIRCHLAWALVVSTAPLALSCREERNPPVLNESPAPAAAEIAAPVEASRVHGFVSYSGEIGVASFPRGEDAACAHRYLDPVEVPAVERNAVNRVAGALVIAKSAPADLSTPATSPPALELRISGCRFSAPIVALEPGQKLRLVNEDDALHSLVAEIGAAAVLDVGLPFAGMSAEVNLPRLEEPIRLRCRRHPWMSAWVARVDRRPWTVTDGEGRFAMAGLDDGAQVFALWHPWLGELEATATVGGGSGSEGAPVELAYPDSAGARRDAAAR